MSPRLRRPLTGSAAAERCGLDAEALIAAARAALAAPDRAVTLDVAVPRVPQFMGRFGLI